MVIIPFITRLRRDVETMYNRSRKQKRIDHRRGYQTHREGYLYYVTAQLEQATMNVFAYSKMRNCMGLEMCSANAMA